MAYLIHILLFLRKITKLYFSKYPAMKISQVKKMTILSTNCTVLNVNGLNMRHEIKIMIYFLLLKKRKLIKCEIY